MASYKVVTNISKLSTLQKIVPTFRLKSLACNRFYSVFNPTYVKPVVSKDDQKALEELDEIKKLSIVPIKPALSSQTSSDLYDPTISKFINYLMRRGKKELARYTLKKVFENIKRIQIKKYHKAPNDKKHEIELNPITILFKAIDNATPVLILQSVVKGGQTYRVPVPISPQKATFLGMNWLIKTASEREDRKIRLTEQLAYELIDASLNTGKTIRKKQDLYRQCEANRSYAHFRWS